MKIKMENFKKWKENSRIHRIIPYSKFEFATISLIVIGGNVMRSLSGCPYDPITDNSATAFIDLDER